MSELAFWSDLMSSCIAGLAAVGAAYVLDSRRAKREAERAKHDELAREARLEAAEAARMERDVEERRADAGRRALLASTEMKNTLTSYIKEHLNPFRELSLRHLILPPVRLVPPSGVNAAELIFLMDDEHNWLVSMLAMNNKNFLALVGNVDARSELRAKECQAAASKILRLRKDTPSYKEMAKSLPREIVEQLADATDEIYKRADQILGNLEYADAQLRLALARKLPLHGFGDNTNNEPQHALGHLSGKDETVVNTENAGSAGTRG